MARVIAFRGCKGLPLNPRQRRRSTATNPAIVALARQLARIRERRPVSFMVLENMIVRTAARIDAESEGGR